MVGRARTLTAIILVQFAVLLFYFQIALVMAIVFVSIVKYIGGI